MSDNEKFNENLDKGNIVELFLSEYFEEIFKWKFVGGNINGKIVNKSSIEEMFSCDSSSKKETWTYFEIF